MSLPIWISIVAVGISTVNLIFSRRDKQSDKSRDAMLDMRSQLDRSQDKIYAREDEILELKRQNQELETKNVLLMKRFIECPAPECPILKPPFKGTERRSRSRPVTE